MTTKGISYSLSLLACAAVTLSFALPPPLSWEEKAASIDPIASVSTGQGEGKEAADAIVQALNADASLKDAKITVRVEKDYVLLTGVAPSQQESQKATEIATSAGALQVVNTIQPRHIVYQQPQQDLGKT